MSSIQKALTRIRAVALFLCVLPGFLSAQTYLGDYTSHQQTGRVLIVRAGAAGMKFTFYSGDIIRIDFLPTLTTVSDSSFVVVRDTSEALTVGTSTTDSTVEFWSPSLRVVCQKSPLRARFLDQSGRLLLAEPVAGGLACEGLARSATFSLSPDEHLYGTGERAAGLDLRGQAFDSYNSQWFGYSSPPPTMNINIPFLASTQGYAMYVDNTYPGRFDLGASDPSRMWYRASGGELTYYVIAAPTVREQLERYAWLTGNQPLPPRWAFGYIQSKYGYQNDVEARDVVFKMRQKHIPCDAVVLDLFWYDRMGDLAWNTSAWPNYFGMMGDFLGQGIKTIAITQTYITQSSLNFTEAASLGNVGTTAGGQPYVIPNWWAGNTNAYLLDVTKPSARSWWWSKHPPFFGTVLAGIWTDLGEPERHPDDMLHSLGSTARVHNIYNLLWAKAIFEGYNQFRPNQRLFNLTRSGFAGIQRYGVITWSGDVWRSFSGLALQVPILLGMGLSGLGYHNSDIGGFAGGGTTPELYVRWIQFGAFCPIMRAHGAGEVVGGQPTEPWGYGATAEAICRSYIELRYRLLPYIYTMAHGHSVQGVPIARPVFFECPGYESSFSTTSSYFFGDAFLVTPVVTQGQVSAAVELPQGVWFNFWTDDVVGGSRTVTIPTPLETVPLFVRAGSIIPMQPLMNYSDERPLDTLLLSVYPSEGVRGQFSLYEDDGFTLDYQNASYALTALAQSVGSSPQGKVLTLDIGATVGSYTGKPARRVYVGEIHAVGREPTSVRVNGNIVVEAASYEALRQGGNGYFYDVGARRLLIQVLTVPDSAYTIVAEGTEITGAAEGTTQPHRLELGQNYPNPFNAATTMTFRIPHAGHATVRVYDMVGREVATILNEHRAAGEYSVTFDGRNLASGVYFYRLMCGGSAEVKSMVLLR